MDSSLIRLPVAFERALADLRAARTAEYAGGIPFQVWRANAETVVAIPHRPGRGASLRGGFEDGTLYWESEDGMHEQLLNVPEDVALQIDAGLLVIYLDSESSEPVGEAILTKINVRKA